MRRFSDYFDNYKLIVQKDGNAGDTCQRMGYYYFWLSFIPSSGNFPYPTVNDFKNAYFKLEKRPGRLCRHPKPGWWSNDNRISRDQLKGLLFGMWATDSKDLAKRIFKEHLSRGLLFAYNTGHNNNEPGKKIPDLTLFDIWALYIRIFKTVPLYPLLPIFDLQLVVNAMGRFLRGAVDPNDVDDLNFVGDLIIGLETKSIWAKPALWIYRHRNPKPIEALRHYFRYETDAPPFMQIIEEKMRSCGF
jgi:hypothetical protein